MQYGDWKDLFSAQAFSGAATKTSGGLYVVGAEAVEFEFTGSGSGTVTPVVLYDPSLDGSSLASATSAQASSPDLATQPETATYSFADVTGKTLTTTAPLLGRVLFVNLAGGVARQGLCPFHRIYLQLVSSASCTVSVRARALFSGPTAAPAVAGSVV